MAQNVLTEGAFWIGGIHYVRQKYLNCSHLTESWCSFKFFVIGWLYYPAESTLVFTQLCQKERTKTRSVKSYWMVQWYVDIRLFAMCASPMIQLCLPPKFCITFVFNFSWVLRLSQEKNKCSCKILGGKHGALCEMCQWQIPVLYIVAFCEVHSIQWSLVEKLRDQRLAAFCVTCQGKVGGTRLTIQKQ